VNICPALLQGGVARGRAAKGGRARCDPPCSRPGGRTVDDGGLASSHAAMNDSCFPRSGRGLSRRETACKLLAVFALRGRRGAGTERTASRADRRRVAGGGLRPSSAPCVRRRQSSSWFSSAQLLPSRFPPPPTAAPRSAAGGDQPSTSHAPPAASEYRRGRAPGGLGRTGDRRDDHVARGLVGVGVPLEAAHATGGWLGYGDCR